MNDELMDGIARKKRQQTLELVCAGVAYTRFDGDGERRVIKNAIQKAL